MDIINIERDKKGKFVKGHKPYRSWLGKHLPEKMGEKLKKTQFKKGQPSLRKGVKSSEETKRKLSEAHKGQIPWNKGRHRSEKTRMKISKAHKGKKLSKETIKKIMKRRVPSSLEEEFQEIITKYNLPYKFVGNGEFFIERFNPDFININSEKIAIEVYARFYKQLGGRDIENWKKERTEAFKKYGWKIIYFDETQVNENYILDKLK